MPPVLQAGWYPFAKESATGEVDLSDVRTWSDLISSLIDVLAPFHESDSIKPMDIDTVFLRDADGELPIWRREDLPELEQRALKLVKKLDSRCEMLLLSSRKEAAPLIPKRPADTKMRTVYRPSGEVNGSSGCLVKFDRTDATPSGTFASEVTAQADPDLVNTFVNGMTFCNKGGVDGGHSISGLKQGVMQRVTGAKRIEGLEVEIRGDCLTILDQRKKTVYRFEIGLVPCSITFDHDTEHLKPQWYAMDLTALREGIISDKDMSRVGEKYGGSWSKGNAKDYLKLYYADASADVLWKRAVALAEAMSGFRERPTMFSTPDKVAQAIQERPGKLGEGAFGQVHKLELGAVTRAVKIVPISRNESLGLNKNGFAPLDEKEMMQLYLEARILVQLNHECLITLRTISFDMDEDKAAERRLAATEEIDLFWRDLSESMACKLNEKAPLPHKRRHQRDSSTTGTRTGGNGPKKGTVPPRVSATASDVIKNAGNGNDSSDDDDDDGPYINGFAQQQQEYEDKITEHLKTLAALHRQKEECERWVPKFYLVMDYAQGGDLSGYLRKKDGTILPRMETTILSRLWKEFFVGLDFLHDHKLIHRDLKPENIVLDISEGIENLDDPKFKHKTIVRIVDFGVARDFSAAVAERSGGIGGPFEHQTSHASAGTISKRFRPSGPDSMLSTQAGTMTYMAPEVDNITDKGIYKNGITKVYTTKVDIYSSALIVLESWTRQRPYQEYDQFELTKKVHEGCRPAIPDDLPPFLTALIRRAWSPIPEVRPTAGQMLQIIREEDELMRSLFQPVEGLLRAVDSRSRFRTLIHLLCRYPLHTLPTPAARTLRQEAETVWNESSNLWHHTSNKEWSGCDEINWDMKEGAHASKQAEELVQQLVLISEFPQAFEVGNQLAGVGVRAASVSLCSRNGDSVYGDIATGIGSDGAGMADNGYTLFTALSAYTRSACEVGLLNIVDAAALQIWKTETERDVRYTASSKSYPSILELIRGACSGESATSGKLGDDLAIRRTTRAMQCVADLVGMVVAWRMLPGNDVLSRTAGLKGANSEGATQELYSRILQNLFELNQWASRILENAISCLTNEEFSVTETVKELLVHTTRAIVQIIRTGKMIPVDGTSIDLPKIVGGNSLFNQRNGFLFRAVEKVKCTPGDCVSSRFHYEVAKLLELCSPIPNVEGAQDFLTAALLEHGGDDTPRHDCAVVINKRIASVSSEYTFETSTFQSTLERVAFNMIHKPSFSDREKYGDNKNYGRCAHHRALPALVCIREEAQRRKYLHNNISFLLSKKNGLKSLDSGAGASACIDTVSESGTQRRTQQPLRPPLTRRSAVAMSIDTNGDTVEVELPTPLQPFRSTNDACNLIVTAMHWCLGVTVGSPPEVVVTATCNEHRDLLCLLAHLVYELVVEDDSLSTILVQCAPVLVWLCHDDNLTSRKVKSAAQGFGEISRKVLVIFGNKPQLHSELKTFKILGSLMAETVRAYSMRHYIAAVMLLKGINGFVAEPGLFQAEFCDEAREDAAFQGLIINAMVGNLEPGSSEEAGQMKKLAELAKDRRSTNKNPDALGSRVSKSRVTETWAQSKEILRGVLSWVLPLLATEAVKQELLALFMQAVLDVALDTIKMNNRGNRRFHLSPVENNDRLLDDCFSVLDRMFRPLRDGSAHTGESLHSEKIIQSLVEGGEAHASWEELQELFLNTRDEVRISTLPSAMNALTSLWSSYQNEWNPSSEVFRRSAVRREQLAAIAHPFIDKISEQVKLLYPHVKQAALPTDLQSELTIDYDAPPFAAGKISMNKPQKYKMCLIGTVVYCFLTDNTKEEVAQYVLQENSVVEDAQGVFVTVRRTIFKPSQFPTDKVRAERADPTPRDLVMMCDTTSSAIEWLQGVITMVELMKLAVNVHKSCDPFLKKIALDGRFASDHHDVYGWILLLGDIIARLTWPRQVLDCAVARKLMNDSLNVLKTILKKYAIDEVDNGDDLEVLTARTWLAKQWPQRLVDIAALIYRDKATDQDIIDCVSECQGHLNTYKLRQWPSLDRAPRGNCPEIEQEVISEMSGLRKAWLDLLSQDSGGAGDPNTKSVRMMLLSFDDAEELSKALLRNDHIESIELYGLSTENPLLKGQNHTAIFVESDLVDVFTSVRSLRYLKLRDFEINELVADGISQIMERRPRGAKAQVILERCGFSGVANAKLLDAKVKADMFKDEFGPGRETLVFNNCENKTIELGYFTKKAPKKKMFTGGDRKRYFVLDGPVLLYYKDAEKKVIGKEWPKQIMLSKQSVVKRAIQSSKEKTSDMIELKTMRRSYFLKTSGAKEVKVNIERIQRAIAEAPDEKLIISEAGNSDDDEIDT